MLLPVVRWLRHPLRRRPRRHSAEGVYAETKADAERDLARVRGELDELTKQRDSISVYLAQMRQMVATLLPDSGDNG